MRATASLRARFTECFWYADEDCFALALDGHKQPVRSVTSNAAHALFCGIAEPGHAGRLATRLMAEDMFSGWGLRTLSSASPGSSAAFSEFFPLRSKGNRTSSG